MCGLPVSLPEPLLLGMDEINCRLFYVCLTADDLDASIAFRKIHSELRRCRMNQVCHFHPSDNPILHILCIY